MNGMQQPGEEEQLFHELEAWETQRATGGPINPWIILAQGAALAVIVSALGFPKFVVQMLATLIHELGHSAAAWIVGVPAVPALDFMHGGGMSIQQEQSVGILLCIYGGLGVAAYIYRHNRLTLALLGGGAVLHLFAVLTRLDDFWIVVMGHGTEFIFSAIFLYRGMTGAAVVHAIERPLYACLGFVLPLLNGELAVRLLTSPAQRQVYRDAKNHVIEMDFTRIADEFLHVDLTTVAALHLLACFTPLVLAILAYRFRDRFDPLWDRLAER